MSFTLIIFIILSFDPDSKSFPSLEKSTVLTGAVWAFMVCDNPLLFCLNLIILFYFIEFIFIFIFISKIKFYTLFVHNLTVSSFDAEAIKFPFPEIARSRIAPLWPMNL